MLNSSFARFWLACAALCALAAFLFQFWPLALAAILIAAFSGNSFFSIGLAFLLDIAYGVPPGALAYLFFPLTLCALGTIAIRQVSKKYFFDASEQSTL